MAKREAKKKKNDSKRYWFIFHIYIYINKNTIAKRLNS
jgi:hypothetical protein